MVALFVVRRVLCYKVFLSVVNDHHLVELLTSECIRKVLEKDRKNICLVKLAFRCRALTCSSCSRATSY
jgi:hypothetical protein